MNKIDLDRLQPVLDALQDGVFITSGEGVIRTVNQAYERMTGLQRHRIVGRPVGDLVRDGYISKSVSLEVIRDRQPATLVQTLMGDRQILVSGNPMYDSEGRITHVVTNVRDVTELLQAKHAEQQLEQILSRVEQAGAGEDSTLVPDGLLVGCQTKACYSLAKKTAATSVKILIHGETGTGKSQLAKYIHLQSERATNPFVALNCAAMPEGLIEAELFGYEAGAFTGASSKGKPGLLEVANGGSLFLDEIGDLPLALQAKLLKVIEDNKYFPVGGTRAKTTNVRLITATHHDLAEAIEEGRFREDLYFRINVLPITLPALRHRQDEILPLFHHYLRHFSEAYQQPKTITDEVAELLLQHSWPGNIRELINLTERLVVTTDHENIDLVDLPPELGFPDVTRLENTGASLKDQVTALEKRLIEAALRQYGSTRAAAAALGINQSTLVKKRKSFKDRYRY